MAGSLLYIIAILFGVVIAIAASIYIFNQLFGSLNTAPAFSSCTTCQTAFAKGQAAQGVFANAIVLLFIVICFVDVILGAFLDSSPIFLIFEVITLPITLLVSFVFHDAFFQIAQNSFIGSALTGYPLIGLLFQWLPAISLVMVALVAIVTFSRGNG